MIKLKSLFRRGQGPSSSKNSTVAPSIKGASSVSSLDGVGNNIKSSSKKNYHGSRDKLENSKDKGSRDHLDNIITNNKGDKRFNNGNNIGYNKQQQHQMPILQQQQQQQQLAGHHHHHVVVGGGGSTNNNLIESHHQQRGIDIGDDIGYSVIDSTLGTTPTITKELIEISFDGPREVSLHIYLYVNLSI